jgi:hypothetical protein
LLIASSLYHTTQRWTLMVSQLFLHHHRPCRYTYWTYYRLSREQAGLYLSLLVSYRGVL